MMKVNSLFSIILLLVNKGILSNEETIEDSFSFESREVDIGLKNNHSNLLYESSFYSSLETQLYQRKYQKFQDTLANLGGFIHVLLSIGWILMSLPLEFYLTKTLVNDIYSFQPVSDVKKQKGFNKEKNFMIPEIQRDKESDKKNVSREGIISPKEIKNELMENIHSDDIPQIQLGNQLSTRTMTKAMTPLHFFNDKKKVSSEKIPPKKLGSDIVEDGENVKSSSPYKKFSSAFGDIFLKRLHKTTKDKFELFRQKLVTKFKLSISFSSFLSLKFRKMFKIPKTKLQNLFNISEKALKAEMDIAKVLMKLHDLEKLKVILFDENQLMLFNMIGNPMIYLEKDRGEDGTMGPEYKMGQRLRLMENINEEKFRNVRKYYVEQEGRGALREMDKRLIEMTRDSIEKFNDYFT